MLTAVEILRLTDGIILSCAAIGCAYLLLAAYLVLTMKPQEASQGLVPVPVSVLVPLCGEEPGLTARLRVLLQQDYPAPVQVICGVDSPVDPAIAAVETVVAERAGENINLKVDQRSFGRNRKVSNLANMISLTQHETLVLIDSDVEVDSQLLRRVVGLLQVPGVGAVTSPFRSVSPFRGVSGSAAPSQLSALILNACFLPDAILALRLKLAQPCFGASIALSRRTLARIGGLPSLADSLCDDYALGVAVRELGLDVAVEASAVTHVCCEQSWRGLFSTELRAALTARSIAPLGQLGRFVVYPFSLAVIALFIGGGTPAVSLAAIALVCRAVTFQCFAHRFGGVRQPTALLPLAELIVFAAYAASWFCSIVEWRGKRYQFAGETARSP